MVGTFYTSPTPSAPPIVTVGDYVVAGQTIGIIEAMKIMNEITTDRAGVVMEFLVDNAQPVEYGSPLLRVSDTRG
jgi:acetyl-CoA carboxylase biotin carboxyl carrier protein